MQQIFHREWFLPSYWWKRIFWYGITGTVITVRWLPQDKMQYWEEWLTKFVGPKGWNWDWRTSVDPSRPHEIRFGLLEIKFRKGRDEFATLVLLKWENEQKKTD